MVREAKVPLCGPRCFNAIFEEVDDEEKLTQVQVPDGQGAYRQVVRYYHVGRGQGDFEPVPETSGTGIGMLPVAATVASLFLVLILAVPALYLLVGSHKAPDAKRQSSLFVDCDELFPEGSQRAHYCCERHGSNCYGIQDYGSDFSERFDCFDDKWHGWSTEKKDWCCEREGRGCAQYDCDGDVHFWAAAQSQWCCENAQICSPASTPAPMAPVAQAGPVAPASPCVRSCITRDDGEEVKSTCIDRIHWAKRNFFAGKDSACALAYSRVQVDCDVCRDCSIQEAGCPMEVH
ncbi:unnamed protein product [Cladocopium goreaui]|uniref:Uncharacterized protein n=1 Tax=Cladocopium goreaui TaxID=2562237 RepID=A0A9P1D3G8_9DINO|nr:unnamed protein product [Cladocopium goreaui]